MMQHTGSAGCGRCYVALAAVPKTAHAMSMRAAAGKNRNCASTVSDMTINGKSSSSWSFDGVRPVLKFTKLTGFSGNQGSVQVCFTLRAGACSTLEQLCPGGSCPTAVFNPPGNACCPAKTAYWA